jgi:hypothetical protein
LWPAQDKEDFVPANGRASVFVHGPVKALPGSGSQWRRLTYTLSPRNPGNYAGAFKFFADNKTPVFNVFRQLATETGYLQGGSFGQVY